VLELIFRKRTGFLLLVVLLCVTGVLLITRLPVQLYPRTQRPRVRVWLEHPGYTAVDFSTEYADAIESQLLAVEREEPVQPDLRLAGGQRGGQGGRRVGHEHHQERAALRFP
jgi:multidrug efflux pump subunit AcrB